MGQFRQITRTVTMAAAGGADTGRAWDAPTGTPIVKLSIIINSGGTVAPAGDLDWEIFYGGNWSGGTPFAAASTHAGGVSQGSGTVTGGTEIIQVIHTNVLLPANSINNSQGSVVSGFPFVVELTNKKAVAFTAYITFVTECAGTSA